MYTGANIFSQQKDMNQKGIKPCYNKGKTNIWQRNGVASQNLSQLVHMTYFWELKKKCFFLSKKKVMCAKHSCTGNVLLQDWCVM